MQENWALVLDLATDTAPPRIHNNARNHHTHSNTSPNKISSRAAEEAKAQAAAVRRHAVNVVDDVHRNGLAPPWEAIPHLVAATTDPNRWA